MRIAKLIALGVAVSFAAGCGVFKKKTDDDDEGNSEDAIAASSEIQWDTEYRLTGTLERDASRASSSKYTLSMEKLLVVAAETNMRLMPGQFTTKCPAGTRATGVYYTLSSRDGTYLRSTDEIDRVATPIPIDAFPGRVPAGTYTLTVRDYGTGACNIEQAFSFPDPNAASGFPDDSTTVVDVDLIGTWEADDVMLQGIRTNLKLAFDQGHVASVQQWRGDLKTLDYRAKYRLDIDSTPRRMILTVTQVNINDSDRRISAGTELHCIYYALPSHAPYALHWQCQDIGAPGFPVDFDADKAVELVRTSGSGSGIYDFELTKGGNTNVAIPDDDSLGTAYTFEFQTSSSQVVHLGVSFTISHSHAQDLRVKLVAPDGSDVVLFDQQPTTSTYLSRSYGLGGSSLDELDAFSGKSVNGKWKLVVSDEAAGDVGWLTNATLTIRGAY